MSNTELKKLNVADLESIILCEPVTRRGREHFDEIRINTGIDLQSKISIEEFYRDMYIVPKYNENLFPLSENGNEDLYYPYDILEDHFRECKDKLEKFNTKFLSNAELASLLILTGVAGNGKSIEINRKIRKLTSNDSIPDSSKYFFYDLEESSSQYLRGGVIFDAPDDPDNKDNKVLWLFCISLLLGFYDGLVIKNAKDVNEIASKYVSYFVNNGINNGEKEKILFNCVGKYNVDNINTGKALSNAMIDLIDKDKNDPKISIKNILSATIKFIYCITPGNKNYIVFDNIEQYIKLNSRNIPIPNAFLLNIYEILDDINGNSHNNFKLINSGEFGKAFKLILVLRRNTGHNLNGFAHFSAKVIENGKDYTGHFDIWRIWEKKKEHIWEKYLKNRYDPVQSKCVIDILTGMMKDNPSMGPIGISYQARIAPLMNMGIRRNAGTQAYTAISVYEILNPPYPSYIDYLTFCKLLEKTSTNKYMYRMALLEIHHKWMIMSPFSKIRFERLLLGTPSNERKDSDFKDSSNNFIKIKTVHIDEAQQYSITYVRRILAYLSHFPNPYDSTTFEVKPLYDVMNILFTNPDNKLMTPKKQPSANETIDFIPLATVLIALGDTLHKETKGAPMIILDVDDKRMQHENPEEQLAVILKEIWGGGENESNADGRYKSSKFGARITDAGRAFLEDVQPSFSFFAALYCSEEVPLFFLKDIVRIKFVIKRVYDNANKLCEIYKTQATNFCADSKLDCAGMQYLPEKNNKCITFIKRVKTLHIAHLKLYKEFLTDNSKIIGFDSTKLLTADGKDYIAEYINKYNEWSEDIKCF